MPPFDRLQTTAAPSAGVAMTLSHAFTSPVTVGSELLVVVMANVAPFALTVTDNRANSYTTIATFGPGSNPPQMMSVWRCPHAFAGATTVTVTASIACAFVVHLFEFVGPLGLPVEIDEASGTSVDGFREDRYWPVPGDGASYFALVLGLAVNASNLTLWGTALTAQNQPDDLVVVHDPPPPISLIITISAQHSGPTGAVSTVGASLLVVAILYVEGPTLVITDSKSNAWTPLTAYGAPGTVRMRFWYCLNPTVGYGHTFTVSGVSTPIIIFGFANVVAYQTENGTGHSGATTSPQATGSVTPAADGALILTGLTSLGEYYDVGPPVTGADVVDPPVFPLTGGNSDGVQGSVGFYVQPTAAPINTVWSWAEDRTDVAMTTAVFLPVNYAVPGPTGDPETYRTKTANPTSLAP
jgi:hypothetical protein